MEVRFRNRKLQKQYQESGRAQKAYGDAVARKYIDRINIIKFTKSMDELRSLPVLNCHALKGSLKGLWAINLTGFYRLIFAVKRERFEIVTIEQVSKHYDD